MKRFCKTLWAEAVKQHKNYFHSKIIYISLFVWPFLNFVTTWYGFQSFRMEDSRLPWLNATNLVAYLTLGYICLSFFRSLVQSAWNFSFERQSGTLELLYLSPANWQAILLGNALSSLVESAMVMFVFGAGLLAFNRQALNAKLLPCMAVFVVTCVMAVLWGMFLNALFLYSRDSGMVFTLLEEPMEIFGGVKVPAVLLPLWGRVISCIFPLTYALEAVRRVFLNGAGFAQLKGFFLAGGCCILLLYGLTIAGISVVGKHSRKTGNFTLF